MSTDTVESATDGRLARGRRTREAVLVRAADVASVDGLEGLSIGRLASDLGVSKAGVFAHFGSKEALQLATIECAADRFAAKVLTPALQAPEGIGQLWALCDRWLDYARDCVFPGGCFFLNVAAEFDAKPGPVREAIAEAHRKWLGAFEAASEQAKGSGEVDPTTDSAALAFELAALGMVANLHATLCDDSSIYDQARASMLSRLRAIARDPAGLPTI